MNSRERVRKALNFEEADRPPIDLGSTLVTGISAWIYPALKEALGIHGGATRVYDLWQMLAEVEEPVLDALGCDFVMLSNEQLSYGLSRRSGWRDYTFWDGQTFQMPMEFRPQLMENGDLLLGDGPNWTIPTGRMPVGCRYIDHIKMPELLTDIEATCKHERDWKFPGPIEDDLLERILAQARALYKSTDRALVAQPPFGLSAGYGGTIEWGMRMALEPEHCKEYVMAQCQASAQRARQYLSLMGEYVDVVMINGADYGIQDREAFRPELFKEIMMPGWKIVCDAVHEFPGVKVFVHSCGSIPKLIGYMVEAGVDCLNPVQWTAAGMDRKWMKQTFGNQLTFWGGSVATQSTFPFGTPEQVRDEARACLDIFAPGGGYVVNPIHNIQADVPIANILALYETARLYRY